MDLYNLAVSFLICLLAAVFFMTGAFALGRRMRRYDIVDVAWGMVFIVIAVSAALVRNDTPRVIDVVVLLLVVIWGVRLSSHIYRRFRAAASEDRRYVELRSKWRPGNESVAIFFKIYMTQALLATLVSLPVIVILTTSAQISLPFVILGVIMWVIGFTIEAFADRQLRQFIRNPENKGMLMTRGLWRYSRHPNYFGELTLWWGVGVIALGVPFGWMGLLGCALISYLIIFVSGIPPTEKAFAGRPGWDAYKKHTSILVPWVVRKETMT